jgi:hypothetical protein
MRRISCRSQFSQTTIASVAISMIERASNNELNQLKLSLAKKNLQVETAQSKRCEKACKQRRNYRATANVEKQFPPADVAALFPQQPQQRLTQWREAGGWR